MLRALPGTRFAQKVLLTVTVVLLRRGPKHLQNASSRANKSSSYQICPTHTYLPATTLLPVSLLPLWLLASVPPLDPVSSSGFLCPSVTDGASGPVPKGRHALWCLQQSLHSLPERPWTQLSGSTLSPTPPLHCLSTLPPAPGLSLTNCTSLSTASSGKPFLTPFSDSRCPKPPMLTLH